MFKHCYLSHKRLLKCHDIDKEYRDVDNEYRDIDKKTRDIKDKYCNIAYEYRDIDKKTRDVGDECRDVSDDKLVIRKCDAPFIAVVFYSKNKKGRSMQAYKLNATIDESGHLIIDEPLNIAPGKVEVIILQPVPSLETSIESQPEMPKRQTKIKALQG